MGGSVKSNAAASQSSGRRGILLSLLFLLLLMLVIVLVQSGLFIGSARSASLTGTDLAPASTGENAVAR
jgi:hypothetical protein